MVTRAGRTNGPVGSPPAPPQVTLEHARAGFEHVLGQINNPKNDVAHADFWAMEQGKRSKPVSSAIKLEVPEARKLIGALMAGLPEMRDLILAKVLPERLEGARHGGIFLSRGAAELLTKYAKESGLDVKYEAKKPILPMASPMMPPGPVALPQGGEDSGQVGRKSVK